MAQFYSAKRRVTTRQIITVTVNDLDPFGQGVARHQGKALFVSGVLPHEQAEVALVEDKKQYARAEVKRRLTDSPQRQAPRCPHFGVCGGCQQQHASVPRTLELELSAEDPTIADGFSPGQRQSDRRCGAVPCFGAPT